MQPTTRELLIALHHIPGIGPQKWNQMLHQLDNPLQILEWPTAQLEQWLGPNGSTLLRQWRSQKSGNWLQQRLDQLSEWLQQPRHHLITLLDDTYPSLLREAKGPLLLHLCGEPDVLNLPQIAIVGARKPTSAGRKNAFSFAQQLSAGGFAITSGMALGIDAAAHEGALSSSGKTIAVLGSGLNQIYPKSNLKLAENIIEQGALVSEFALDVEPQAGHFPRRNRIVSGLALGLLVVEAAVKSGSLISARMALEQNREVFAVPGSIHSAVSEGCHQLIRAGATLVDRPEQIVQQLGVELGGLTAMDAPKSETAAYQATNSAQRKILAALGYELLSFEDLLIDCGLSYSELHHNLSVLELANAIISSEQGYQRRV